MSELRDRLREILTGYRIEEELGGGGMSRVFLADEPALTRRVVIKVLPPEMAAGVNKERFRRETQLAASLQHPLIVPILTAGVATDGDGSDLLYYVMPFIEGQSLRKRLASEGKLSVNESMRILRDVADALARAHALGVVHRDIKPDNVMLSGKHALVTDFGIAKALSAAQDPARSDLTQMGMALGTPMYMSPEQAAGDPNADERSDLYALGVMGYEMLTGRLPFEADTPQAMLAAHVSQTPRPLREHRLDIPPACAELVMQCLEKQPAHRPQSADRFHAGLDEMLGTSGSFTPSHTSAVNIGHFVQTSSPARVAATFGVGATLLVAMVYMLTMQLGLPAWTIWGAVVLAVLGVVLPAGVARGGSRGGGLTWSGARATLLSCAGLLGLAVVGFSGMRSLGIGPAGTLVTAGQLEERDRIILAQFANATSDSTLGETITELLRVDFAQSPTLTLLEPVQITEVLRRMQRPPETPLTETLATEVAQREGVKAILTGDIRAIGAEYIVSARVVASSGETLTAARETAAAAGLIDAVDDLSASLRKKIGESLRSIRSDPPLDQVTTQSTEALRLFAQADRANNLGQYQRAIGLLEEAIRLDTLFAMAHRKLAIILSNRSQEPDRAQTAFTRAYELRDRLTERERFLAEAAYFDYVEGDVGRSNAAYTSLLERYPTDPIGLNNLAVSYRAQGRFDEAVELYRRSIAAGVAPTATYTNAIDLEYSQGNVDSSASLVTRFKADYPEHPQIPSLEAALFSAAFDYDDAEPILREWRDASRGDPVSAATALFNLASLEAAQGRMNEALRHYLEGYDVQEAASLEFLTQPKALVEAELHSWIDVFFLNEPGRAAQRLDRVRRELDHENLPVDQRDDLQLAALYARTGRLDEARELIRAYRGDAEDQQSDGSISEVLGAEAAIAIEEERYDDAVRALHEARANLPGCRLCHLTELARAFAESGQLDSAVVYYRQYLETPQLHRLQQDSFTLWSALLGLGAAQERLGNTEAALDAYGRLIDLWENADPELQVFLDDVRGRVERLVEEGR